VLTVYHRTDLAAGVTEMRRVAGRQRHRVTRAGPRDVSGTHPTHGGQGLRTAMEIQRAPEA
jgi:hypothetical protein